MCGGSTSTRREYAVRLNCVTVLFKHSGVGLPYRPLYAGRGRAQSSIPAQVAALNLVLNICLN